MKGIHFIILLLVATILSGGLFYYSLQQTSRFQAETGPLMRTRFLQTLIAREGQMFWRVGNEALPLDEEHWDFTVRGRELNVAIRSAVPLGEQVQLVSEITNTVRSLLRLEPANTDVKVQFKDSAAYHQ